MEIILFVICALYCIYLNVRLRDVEDISNEREMDVTELEIKLYNKMMEIRKDLKDEKSGREPAKKRRRLSKVAISKGKILRKPRRDKDNLQAGGKG